MLKAVLLRQRFAERVKAALGETGLSSEDLAAQSALPVRRIENILNGSHVRITLADMCLIAFVLGTPLSKLLAA